ncbi:MAG: hypothetical protein ACOYN4_05750 [Bacteroidales bacterium]
MAKKFLFLTAFFTLVLCACQQGQNSQVQAQGAAGVHKVLVKEVLQTSKYTYLLVVENSEENWLALPKMEASTGETYYYRNGFKMTDFESKELNRKFAVVYFLESISKTPEIVAREAMPNPHTSMPQITDSASAAKYTANVVVEKENVKVQPAEEGITIAELLADKQKYAGKTIRIKGKVTKFNAKIMSRNWIHIQDGTEYSGKFDLTATTDIEATVGETITLEGTITLDKDFGYGYSYEVLMEDAKPIK